MLPTLSPGLRVLAVVAALVSSVLVNVPSQAQSSQVAGSTTTSGFYAPINRPGPRLRVKAGVLAEALRCHGNLRTAPGEPVLLSPATGVTPKQNYSWNYERAFAKQGRAWCTITMPFHTLGDIQIAGEYLVYAIRTMHNRAHRRIAVVGHSQGGMSMRWALRFWPDTRAMVDDVIGMAGSNHGTTSPALALLPPGAPLPPATRQQGADSHFIKALNSRAETFAGISYTEIYSHTDEVVQPAFDVATASSALRTGEGRITNVATQSVCPLDVYEHLSVGTVDPTAYALVMDALNHAGPAKPARIGKASCARLYQPGVNPLNVSTYLELLSAVPSLVATTTPYVNVVGAPLVTREPVLRCYVRASGC